MKRVIAKIFFNKRKKCSNRWKILFSRKNRKKFLGVWPFLGAWLIETWCRKSQKKTTKMAKKHSKIIKKSQNFFRFSSKTIFFIISNIFTFVEKSFCDNLPQSALPSLRIFYCLFLRIWYSHEGDLRGNDEWIWAYCRFQLFEGCPFEWFKRQARFLGFIYGRL